VKSGRRLQVKEDDSGVNCVGRKRLFCRKMLEFFPISCSIRLNVLVVVPW